MATTYASDSTSSPNCVPPAAHMIHCSVESALLVRAPCLWIRRHSRSLCGACESERRKTARGAQRKVPENPVADVEKPVHPHPRDVHADEWLRAPRLMQQHYLRHHRHRLHPPTHCGTWTSTRVAVAIASKPHRENDHRPSSTSGPRPSPRGCGWKTTAISSAGTITPYHARESFAPSCS